MELLHGEKLWVCGMRSLPGNSIDRISTNLYLPSAVITVLEKKKWVHGLVKRLDSGMDRSLIFPEIT